MVLCDFNGPVVPRNKGGEAYPSYYANPTGRKEGGKFTATIDTTDAIAGSSLRMHLTSGTLYAQFNPYGPKGREFARDYCAHPKKWQFNTYNRMRFWIKVPVNASPLAPTGQENMNVGTYVKQVVKANPYSDEAGGNHYYHNLNIAPTGQWTQVILNMHPSHIRGTSGGKEHGNVPHPTGEEKYDYFDALTRFYIQGNYKPKSYPADYLLDEIEFYQEPNKENDDQVYSLTAVYVPKTNRLLVTWCRNKDENKTTHEVRYAFADIHKVGWKAAQAAPKGILAPLGWQGYNGMIYDSTALPLAKRNKVYVAIKPRNSDLFSQIVIPLKPGSDKKVSRQK
jgi:hypothetical protein